MLELRNIFKDYYIDKKPFHALKDINLSFAKQGFVAILGPSGCGKTTLLNLIGGLDHYTSGDLVIEGKSTKDFDEQDWDAYRNHRIGFVFQTYNLITHLSVLENVEMALTLAGVEAKERRIRAQEALKSVGLETEYNKKINQLSGGQTQRVAIARALINNPDIILADEPTGALDTKTSIGVLDILKEIAKTRLVIMVTHNERLAKEYSERIITMLDGVVTEDSRPLDLSAEVFGKETNKRTSMSFWTAIKTTWKNIQTKRGRTTMTSIAASFGIIGVALVLAVSNGFSGYVGRVERGTLSSYPIGVYADSYSMVRPDPSSFPAKFPDEEKVVVQDDTQSSNQFLTIKHNIITPDYIDYLKQMETDGIASSVVINYLAYFNLVGEKPDASPDGVGVYEMGRTSYDAAFNPIPSGNFHELLGGESFINEYYDLIGTNSRYPANENEAVLIVNQYNQIEKSKLINLGIISQDFTASSIDFDQFIDRKFKVYNNSDYYREKTSFLVADAYTGQDKEIKIFRGPTNAENDQMFLDDNVGENLNIVGILRVKPEKALYDLMDSGIGYTAGLKDRLLSENAAAPIAAALENNFKVNLTPSELETLIGDLFTGPDAGDPTSALASNDFIRSVYTFYSPFNYDYNDIDTTPTPKRNLLMTGYFDIARRIGAPLDGGNYFLNILGSVIETKTGLTFAYPLLDLTYSRVYSIAIFATDSTGKKEIVSRLNEWNVGKSETEKIEYSDLVATITDSLGTLVDVVAAVLIVFSSISLLVSSVMIGVITYSSVVERTKEIGILRAIGARKKDIKRLFNAETFIIGLFSGSIGIGVTLILSIVINIIINNLYPQAAIGAIALLNPLAAIALVSINIGLTLLCGLIPAQVAADKDPVVALRTE